MEDKALEDTLNEGQEEAEFNTRRHPGKVVALQKAGQTTIGQTSRVVEKVENFGETISYV